jgi:hypothetical protein
LPEAHALSVLQFFDFLKDCKQIEVDVYDSFYNSLEEISKMLFALIKGLS